MKFGSGFILNFGLESILIRYLLKMKILIDIGHPAHVHYFKNIIFELEKEDCQFLVVARDKEVSHKLLEAYNIPYISRGKGKNSAFGKLLYMLKADIQLFKIAKKFNPDLFLSVASPFAAQIAWIMGKPHVAIDDTEAASIARRFYLPFTKFVLTPSCFQKDIGPKQIRISSYTELLHLHPKWFTPKNPSELLGLKKGEKYVVLRFVSWNANHDFGQSGISDKMKATLIKTLEEYNYKIFISSEGPLPEKFQKYKIAIPPERMHDVLQGALLFIGEGATMASECIMLGTPAIYINSLNAGTLQEQAEKYGLISLRNSEDLPRVLEQILDTNFILTQQLKQQTLLKDKIDFTQYLIDFIRSDKICKTVARAIP